MALVLKNNATTTISNDISSTDTNIKAVDTSVFPVTASPDWCWLTIIDQTDDTNYEIVKVTDISGAVLTVERGAEGTTAKSFVTGDIIEQRITRQTLLDLAPAGTSSKNREYLDEIVLSIVNMGIFDENSLININKKYAPRIIQSWDSFYGSRIKSSIYDLTNGLLVEDSIEFATTADIATWISNNVPASAGQATANYILKPFETISDDIQPLTKIVGFNRFYSALKGGDNYKKVVTTAQHSSLSSSIMKDMFNAAHGTAYADDAKFVGCTWITNNSKNIYTTLHKDVVINHTLNNGGSQRWYNDSGDFTQLSSGEENFERVPNKPIVATLSGGSSLSTDTVKNNGDIGRSSSVLVYPVKGKTNANRNAIIVKPIGMDSFQMELPDFNNFVLQAVAYNNTIQSGVIIKEFNSTGNFGGYSLFDTDSGKMLIDKSNFIEIVQSIGQAHSNNNYSYDTHFNTIRFRLRNKTTNEVGKLSSFGIIYENTHKLNTFRFMIKNFNS